MWHSHYASLPRAVLKFFPLMPTVPRGPTVERGSTSAGGGTKPTSLAVLVGQLNVGGRSVEQKSSSSGAFCSGNFECVLETAKLTANWFSLHRQKRNVHLRREMLPQHSIQRTCMALWYWKRCDWESKQINTVCMKLGSVTKAHFSYWDNVRIYEIFAAARQIFLGMMQRCHTFLIIKVFFLNSNDGLQENALFPGAELSQYFSITVNQ